MFFPSLPFSSSSSAAFPFPFCSDLDGVSFQDLTSSRVSIVFLNSHGPLSFTSHCPSRSVLFSFFLVYFPFPLNLTVPLPFVSSPVLSFLVRFPPSQFGFTGGSFRFRFSFPLFTSPFLFLSSLLSFPLLSLSLSSFCPLSSVPPFFSLLSRAGVQSPFIGGKGSGASLWLHGERRSAGRLASGCDWQGAAPSTFHHESVWGGGFGRHVACRVQRGKKKNCLPLLHVQGKEKGEQCRFMKNVPFFLKVAPASFFQISP